VSINKRVPFIIEQKASPIARSIFSLADLCRQRLDQLAATEIDSPPKKK
jgi:MinD-like ATPase involved in chromosome partitioning or flagellar assembly